MILYEKRGGTLTYSQSEGTKFSSLHLYVSDDPFSWREEGEEQKYFILTPYICFPWLYSQFLSVRKGVRQTKESEKYEALMREITQSSKSVLAGGIFSRNVSEKSLKTHGRLLIKKPQNK